MKRGQKRVHTARLETLTHMLPSQRRPKENAGKRRLREFVEQAEREKNKRAQMDALLMEAMREHP